MNKLSELNEFFLDNLLQIKMSVMLSSLVSVVGLFAVNLSATISEWFDLNFDYVTIALGLVAADHLIGSAVHKFWLKDFCWRKNIIGIMIKLSMVVLGGLIFEGLAHITKEQDFVYTYLKMTLRFVVCIYPGLSAARNMRVISGGKFPPAALVGKMEMFEKDLDIKKLKKKDDE